MSSSELYFVLKPDAFLRGIWTEILGSLAAAGRSLEIRLFSPTAKDIIDMHPTFCWDVDDLSDWLALYRRRPTVVGLISQCRWSYGDLAERKGATFQPKPDSIRGQANVTRRVSNILHTPTNNTENDALGNLFDQAATTDRQCLAKLLSDIDDRVFDLPLDALADRLAERAIMTRAPAVLVQIARALQHQEPGSATAKLLVSNFVALAGSVNLLWSRHERQMLKEAAYYPRAIPGAEN